MLSVLNFYLFVSHISFGGSVYQYLKYTYDQNQYLPVPTYLYLPGKTDLIKTIKNIKQTSLKITIDSKIDTLNE